MISPLFYVLCLLEFCIGVIVGASVRKNTQSALIGCGVAILLATLAYVEGIIVAILPMDRPGNVVPYIVGTVIGTLFLGFVVWAILLLSAAAGYWSAFGLSAWLGLGHGRFSLASLLGLVTIAAAIAAIARIDK